MKLQKIELFGFKSFRNKTGIEVGDGITAVVGPNGCGKSNIVDAIRWAMGTQSARSLRGSEMSDVIFAGSRSQKPAGLAEVNLIFENDESHQVASKDVHQAPLKAIVEGSTHLKVTRRLFRTGDTAYLINGVPVRLKDIHELFLGTGASVRGYSIIEQGQIEFLVNARPKERRTFVEELAGVTRYRYHRQETERKLGATQTNLERLEDLLSEVKQRVTQLKYQAQTAKRYEDLTSRKRMFEIALLLKAYQTETVVMAEAEGALKGAIAKYDEQSEGLIASEDELAELEMALTSCEQAHQETTEHFYRLEAKRDLLKQSIEHAGLDAGRLHDERAHLEVDGKDIQTEIVELEAHQHVLEKEVVARAVPDRDDTDLAEQVGTADSAVRAVEAELERIETALRTQSVRLAERSALATGWREEIARLDSGDATWSQRNARALEALTTASEQASSIDSRRAGLDEEARLLDRQLSVAADEIERTGARIDAIRTRVDRVEKLIASRRAQRQVKAESVAAEVSQGARRLLDAAESGELEGIIGALSDGIISPPGAERAVHGVLRDLLEYVVVEDAQAARRAIEFAESNGLVVGCIEARQLAGEIEVRPNSLLGEVQLADWVPTAVAHILDGATPVEHLLLPPDSHEASCLVDRRGNCASAHGFWRATDPSGGALARRARLLKEIADLDGQLVDLDEEREAVEDELSQAQQNLREIETKAEAQRQERDRVRSRRADLDAAEAKATAEVEALKTQAVDLDRSRAAADTRRGELEARLVENEEIVGSFRTELETVEQARESARERRAELRVELERRQHELADFQSVQRQQQAEVKRLTAEQSRTENAAERARDKQVKLTGRLREIGDQLRRLVIEIDTNQIVADETESSLNQARTELDSTSDRREELRSNKRSRVRATNKLRRRCGDMRLEIDRLSIRRDQASREIDRLDQVLRHQHNTSLAEADSICADVELPDEPQPVLNELNLAIERLGPINHAAQEELDQAAERHDFLCNQQADLLAAIGDMQLTIQELDCASRVEFRRTFAALRTEFESLFKHLFRGGEATLELDDDSDPLGAGVEVIVRPPGKKVRSMSLLSGGEKALTAVALVFAAFRLKPSPFCILDEVDAPLDTHNVDRFADLLDEMGDDTQFIVITHNRRTMEGAHKLVGVTMEEPGCSRLMAVSVPAPRRSTSGLDEHELAAG